MCAAVAEAVEVKRRAKSRWTSTRCSLRKIFSTWPRHFGRGIDPPTRGCIPESVTDVSFRMALAHAAIAAQWAEPRSFILFPLVAAPAPECIGTRGFQTWARAQSRPWRCTLALGSWLTRLRCLGGRLHYHHPCRSPTSSLARVQLTCGNVSLSEHRLSLLDRRSAGPRTACKERSKEYDHAGSQSVRPRPSRTS